MSRWLLDAAAVVRAGRHVARQHVAIRTRQMDEYARTSSALQATKAQTERFTLTFQAMTRLRRRLDGDPDSQTHFDQQEMPERRQPPNEIPSKQHSQIRPQDQPEPEDPITRVSKIDSNLHQTITKDELASQTPPKISESIEATSLDEALVDTARVNPVAMQESRVPATRIGRLWEYGGLAGSMAWGAMGERVRRMGGRSMESSSLVLSPANVERLVAKLSRMRGAALKLGQMMSFQDSRMLPAPVNEILQRVQDNANFMPVYQRDQVLTTNLGPGWRQLFSDFEDKPMAAASIGQVHRATLASNGAAVAVKIQYPGVAASIDSDLSNLAVLLTASRLLPKGLFLDKTIQNARTELAWECDYEREAAMGRRFQSLLADEPNVFRVPTVFPEASGLQVLTAEFCTGLGVTKAQQLSQPQKDWIGSNILRLCLREIFEFKFMQTDPNWTNFLYDGHRLSLLDFGASREYPDKFILPYIQTLIAASRRDRDTVRDLSIQLGYLTGHESAAMLNAHVDSVLTLAEPFMEDAPAEYDFANQTITDRVRSFIPIMMRERLAPPPEETYSLHRKLSGAFLLCARLGARVSCREMFAKAVASIDR